MTVSDMATRRPDSEEDDVMADPRPDLSEAPEPDPIEAAKSRLLDAALMHVPFDGWSEKTLQRAIEDSGVDEGLAQLAFPRGTIDLAVWFHDRADNQLEAWLATGALEGMKIREKVAAAVRKRLELVSGDKDSVRYAASLFALPIYAGEGARAIWRTADIIWTGIGDTSDDANWYTKRAILSGVYSSTVLYWLGDTSEGFEDTWAFLDRRIAGVMQFEKLKAQVNSNPLGRLLMTGPNLVSRMVKPPRRA
jgi:ubiquinone biosynthesis protein COQ9